MVDDHRPQFWARDRTPGPGRQIIRATGGVGGGYGDPFKRDAKLVLTDVADGYLTRDEAAQQFGVIIADNGKLDPAATQKRRQPAR